MVLEFYCLFFRTSWCFGVLNSAIFDIFHTPVEFGTILEGLQNFGGGVWTPQTSPLGRRLLPADKGQFTLPFTFQFHRGTSPYSLYRVQYSSSDFLLLKPLRTHIRFLLPLRAASSSSSSNINAIAANCLLANEWRSISDGNDRRPITCCSGKWQRTVWTQTILTGRRWKGNVTHSVNRPWN